MKIKKKLGTIAAILGIVMLAAPAFGSLYVETFNTGSNSWNYGYGTNFAIGTTNWYATGGNPGGYISGTSSNLYAVWTYDTAPYGDITGLTLTVDTMITNTETATAQLYVGRENSYYIQNVGWNIALDTGWTTHQVAMDSSDLSPWAQASASLAYVLAAPDDIGIFFGGAVASGSGILDLDNFGTIPVPVPL